jgi:heme A synthase
MNALRAIIVIMVLLVLVVVSSRGGPLNALESIPLWAIVGISGAFAILAVIYLAQIRARRRRQHRLDPDELAGRRS